MAEPFNRDEPTVRAFSENWSQARAKRSPVPAELFETMFAWIPWQDLGGAEGFDLGCGSGRFAREVAPLVGRLHCIDAAPGAIASARTRLAGFDNVAFHLASVDDIPLPDRSQDFGYSLGVLHHVPDTAAALASCTAKLKRGAPFLLYLYYRFDNRPVWFLGLWKLSDLVRRGVSRLPFRARRAASDAIALLVYWPLSRAARLLELTGMDVEGLPLSFYRRSPLRTLRNDALDRFGTALEQRFTRGEIEAMMRRAGLVDIRFNDSPPWWVAFGRRA